MTNLTPASETTTLASTTPASTLPHTQASATSPTSNTTASGTTSIPASLPAGLITLISPAATLGSTSYYSVGTPITFIWNYTYLLASPTALDILATVSAAGLAIPTPFTLALNTSFQSPQTFIWDTGAFAKETPLPVGSYSLIVYDSDAADGQWTQAGAGKLSAWRGGGFGMYNTQSYTPLADAYVCATCNKAAGGGMERQTWMMLVGTVGMTMGGFVWFVGLAGIV